MTVQRKEMWRLSKRKTLALAGLVLSGCMYLAAHTHFFLAGLTKSQEPFSNDLIWQAERLVSKQSWVEQGDYLPLNVSYQLLAGSLFTQQRFLSIGMCSVQRKKGNYLIETLQSIFSQSSPEECASMVVVVLIADFDHSWRVSIVQEIKKAFPSQLEQGQLVAIHVPQEYYPSLTGLKRNYNDAPDRVSFRSKQNIDYSFLIHYSAGLGQYYLQLEDDVLSAKNFLSRIRGYIEQQQSKRGTWATLEFSTLGYIGKLYKSVDLPLLARFFFLFYQEMPCDWLMLRFRDLLTQKEAILFKPSLFQHMGTFSSFQGTYNKLKDKYFENLYFNPEADVYTNMSIYQKRIPQLAWAAGDEYFWGRSPEKGDHLTVVLRQPTVVTGITIETGLEGKDLLYSAQVAIGHEVVTFGKEEKSCKIFLPVGKIENGVFKVNELDKRHDSVSSCLRIQVTAGQQDWVIIKKIRITTRADSTSTPKYL